MSHIIPPDMVIFPFNMDIYLFGYLVIWVHVCMGTCLYGYSIQQLVSQMWYVNRMPSGTAYI